MNTTMFRNQEELALWRYIGWLWGIRSREDNVLVQDTTGTCKKEALIVVIPSSERISQSASEFSTAKKKPHPKRKQ